MMSDKIIHIGQRKLADLVPSLILLSMMTLIIAQNATAAPIIFFGENVNSNGTVSGDPVTARADFLNTLTGVGTEDFEGFTGRNESAGVNLGDTVPLNLNFPGSTGNIQATLTGDEGEIFGRPGTLPNNGRFATSGDNYLNNITNGFSLEFSTDVAVFGFYSSDIGDFNGQVTVTLESQNGMTQTFTIDNQVNAPNNALHFWGIIDTENPFRKVTFGNTAPGDDVFGIDDLTIGDFRQVVPIPAVIPLFGTGLGMLTLLGWRRRG